MWTCKGVPYHYHTPRSTKLMGVYWSHLVHLSVFSSVDRIVSALYLPQYSPDPFHIYTSHQASSEGVSHVKCFSKLKNLKFWQILWLCFVFTWDPIWINRMGNHGVGVGVSSECRRSSCSSFDVWCSGRLQYLLAWFCYQFIWNSTVWTFTHNIIFISQDKKKIFLAF